MAGLVISKLCAVWFVVLSVLPFTAARRDGLKIFLAALAIVDDMGAVLVIALFIHVTLCGPLFTTCSKPGCGVVAWVVASEPKHG